MHDPLTVAFEVRSPFRGKPTPMWPKGYRSSLVTIWHKDPCCDGSDDSCDWSGNHYGWTEAAEKQARSMLSWSKTEHDVRYFDHPRFDRVVNLPVSMSDQDGPKHPVVFGEVTMGDSFALTMHAIETIAWQMDRRQLNGQLLEWATGMALSPDQSKLWVVETDEEKLRVFKLLIRAYLRFKRPWWRHPRWHFWHWRIQIHPFQRLWRWIFDRCAKCGGRFGRNEARFGLGWDSDQVAHQTCMGVTIGSSQEPS